jgi:hypothetical protein
MSKIVGLNVLLGSLLLLFIGNSCMRPEKPIPPYDRGGVVTNTAAMGNNYQTHVFFNLDSNKIVKIINRMDWDLAFDCEPNSHIILLNNGRGVYAAATGKTDFNLVKDTFGLKINYGQPNLHLDSLALGQWWLVSPEIFVINLGLDNNSNAFGFIKMMPTLLSDKSLKIEWCKLDETVTKTIILSKDSKFNFTYFSILNNKSIAIEPPKADWDLWFTQYVKRVFFGGFTESQDYQLTGVLVNHSKVTMAQDFKTAYQNISSLKLNDYTFINQRDGIGHDWKSFNLGTNAYTVNSSMNYILQIKDGFYYKLHFLDFYNELGVKGYPKFEYQKL